MSRLPSTTERNTESFPRVSGDEPWSVVIFMNFPVFSPRERG